MAHVACACACTQEPIYFSNTRTLERDFGWHGLCIDGSLDLAAKATAQRTCRVVQAIVTGRSGDQVSFQTSFGQHESGYGGIVHGSGGGEAPHERAHERAAASGAGGMEEPSTSRHAEGEPRTATGDSKPPSREGPAPGGGAHFGVKKDRPMAAWQMEHRHTTVSLEDILRHVGAPWVMDYLSLDVEGAEETILLSFLRGGGSSGGSGGGGGSASSGGGGGGSASSGGDGGGGARDARGPAFTFRAMTVERPSKVTRDALRQSGYQYVGDHGCFGDQLWVHRSFAQDAERTLGLQLIEGADSGSADWFANCTARSSWTLSHKLRPWPFKKVGPK